MRRTWTDGGARLVPLGDAAISIELGRVIDPTINARVHSLDRAVQDEDVPGVRETVPAYASLLVHYDPLVVSAGKLLAALRPLAAAVRPRPSPDRRWHADIEIPVVYGGEAGPDLPDVARHAGLSEAEVVRRHAAGRYRVAMLGFAPGFPYLMGVDPALATPRVGTPRVRVPAGSVGIADAQTGVYPYALPGGWRLIGRTALRLFDPLRDPPAVMGPGMRVRFVPVEGAPNTPAGAPSAPRSAPVEADARAIRVLEGGLLTTVQDAGRHGFQRLGVPPSGAADAVSLGAGNLAVGNAAGAAALEITAGGVAFEFLGPGSLALAGAPLDARLSGRPVPFGEPVTALTGEVLELGRPARGLRTYVCVAGSIAVPVVLGSRSTYLPAGFGGLDGRALRSGDLVPFGRPSGTTSSKVARLVVPLLGRTDGSLELPFVPGGQWADVPEAARLAFLERLWRVSHRSDRIGLRLEGEPLATGGSWPTFVTDATVTGAVQLTGDGLPIVLLVDRQTTGGYPKLGAVASVGLHRLGQAQPGDEIRFRPITIADAQEEWRALAHSLGPRDG